MESGVKLEPPDDTLCHVDFCHNPPLVAVKEEIPEILEIPERSFDTAITEFQTMGNEVEEHAYAIRSETFGITGDSYEKLGEETALDEELQKPPKILEIREKPADRNHYIDKILEKLRKLSDRATLKAASPDISIIKEWIERKTEMTQDVNVECAVCNRQFERLAFMLHKKSGPVSLFYQCDVCKTNFSSEIVVKIHLQSHGKCLKHFTKVEIKTEYHNKRLVRFCNRCNTPFSYTSDLLEHLNIESCLDPDGVKECYRCHLYFSSRHLLSKHLKNAHAADVISDNLCQCDDCDNMHIRVQESFVRPAYYNIMKNATRPICVSQKLPYLNETSKPMKASNNSYSALNFRTESVMTISGTDYRSNSELPLKYQQQEKVHLHNSDNCCTTSISNKTAEHCHDAIECNSTSRSPPSHSEQQIMHRSSDMLTGEQEHDSASSQNSNGASAENCQDAIECNSTPQLPSSHSQQQRINNYYDRLTGEQEYNSASSQNSNGVFSTIIKRMAEQCQTATGCSSIPQTQRSHSEQKRKHDSSADTYYANNINLFDKLADYKDKAKNSSAKEHSVWKCLFCNTFFDSQLIMLEHAQKAHETIESFSRLFPIRKCGTCKLFMVAWESCNHVLMNNLLERSCIYTAIRSFGTFNHFCCPICFEISEPISTLVNHMNQTHRIDDVTNTIYRNDFITIFQCIDCKLFLVRQEGHGHTHSARQTGEAVKIKIFRRKGLFSCPICAFEVHSLFVLVNHMNRMHYMFDNHLQSIFGRATFQGHLYTGTLLSGTGVIENEVKKEEACRLMKNAVERTESRTSVQQKDAIDKIVIIVDHEKGNVRGAPKRTTLQQPETLPSRKKKKSN